MKEINAGFLLLVCLIVAAAIVTASEQSPAADGVEAITWEHQNWESNGGYERLTLWSDGCSEVVVVPLRVAHDDQQELLPNSGWELVRYQFPRHVEFIRTNVYPPDVARTKFSAALAAGIGRLKPFPPKYVDGSGTRIVIRKQGQEQEIIIPMFTDSERETLNHKRFLAVAEVLGGFDKAAYTVAPAVSRTGDGH